MRKEVDPGESHCEICYRRENPRERKIRKRKKWQKSQGGDEKEMAITRKRDYVGREKERNTQISVKVMRQR